MIALTEGGTCEISPVNRATAAVSKAWVTPETSAVWVISPSASSVLVDWPSLIVAAYSFSVRVRYPSSLVAFSTPTTRTPVAIGSRVPACPTFLVPASRLIRATTSCDVMPPGLSTMTRPLSGLIRGRSFVVILVLVEVPSVDVLSVIEVLGGLAVRVGIPGVLSALALARELSVGGRGLGD